MNRKRAARSIVLVVEPRADTRRWYREAFEDAGYRVREAERLDEAAALVRAVRPRAIVAAWSGTSAADDDFARLRQASQTRGIPVVVVAAPQPAILLSAIAAGATAAIPAHDHPDAIVQLVGTLIDQTSDLESADDQRVLLTALLENAHQDRYLDQAVRHRAEALLARLIDSRVAILVANNAARYVEANGIACSLTGYSRVELMTKSVWDLTPTPARETGRALWRQFLASGLFDGPYTIARKDGGLLSVHAVAVADVVPGLHVSGLALIAPSHPARARATA